jgi:protoporphyrinogen oxidase
MSGRPFYSRSSGMKPTSRRAFILQAGLVTGAILLNGCIRRLSGGKPEYAHIKGKLAGPNAKAGHALRDKLPMPAPTTQQTVKTLIIGSGISGLSAARWLLKQGETDFQLLELEDHVGGNAYFGSNEVSAYPLGAHYIPIVNNDDKLLIDFLQEHQVITHFDEKGLPFYNEFYLCFDPEERLLINGHWQEGIVPDFGVTDNDRKQIIRFFALVTQLKNAKGNDSKYAFDIPLDNSSADDAYRKLDRISFKDYLKDNSFDSPYLLWYLNYCCKDDYGTPAQNVSAWAGLHYFSARKGTASNADPNAVITWPEGNGWLMKRLRETVKDHIKTGHLAYDVQIAAGGKVAVKVLDLKQNTSAVIYADKVIMASPQYVNQKLLKNTIRPGFDAGKLHYSPWLIANITVNKLPSAAKGMVLCWDNVAYNTTSVGYVNANQQDIKLVEQQKVLTYYLPLCDKEPRIARLAAYTRTYEQWMDIVVPEMEQMHPGITECIEQVEFWLWGHGMISPSVNYIWGDNRQQARLPINNQVFFAHTDLSGVSIFEEAFHQGIRSAQQVLAHEHTTA